MWALSVGTSVLTSLCRSSPQASVSLEGSAFGGWVRPVSIEKWGRQIGQLLLPFLTTKRKLVGNREIIILIEPRFLALLSVI